MEAAGERMIRRLPESCVRAAIQRFILVGGGGIVCAACLRARSVRESVAVDRGQIMAWRGGAAPRPLSFPLGLIGGRKGPFLASIID